METRNNTKTFLIVIIVLILIAATAFFINMNKKPNKILNSTDGSTQQSTLKNIHNDETNNYSISYPDGWNIENFPSNGDNIPFFTSTVITSPSNDSFIEVWIRSGDWEQVKADLSITGDLTNINGSEVIVQNLQENNLIHTLPGKKNNQVFQIIASSNSSDLEEQALIAEIISSFRAE